MGFGLLKNFLQTSNDERVEVLYRYLVQGESGTQIAESYYNNKNYAWKISAITQGYSEKAGVNRGKIVTTRENIKKFIATYPKGTYDKALTLSEWLEDSASKPLSIVEENNNLSIDFDDVAFAVKTHYKFDSGADHTFMRYESFCDALERDIYDIHPVLEYFVYITYFSDKSIWLPWGNPVSSYSQVEYADLFNKLSNADINFIKYRLFDTRQMIKELGKEEEFLTLDSRDQSQSFKSVYANLHRIYLAILKIFVVDYQIDKTIAIRFLKKIVAYKLNIEVLDHLVSHEFYITSDIYSIPDERWIDMLIEVLISNNGLTSKEQMVHYYLYLNNWSLESYPFILKAMYDLHLNEDLTYVLTVYDKERFIQELSEIEEWIDFRLTRKELKELFDIVRG